jgi:hypothetical protein
MDKALANVKTDAQLLAQAKVRAAQETLRRGRKVTVQEIFERALRRELQRAMPK